MFVGTALSVRLLVYVGLYLFIINGPYVYMVVCVVYAYNLTVGRMLEYKMFLRHTRNFLKRMTLRLPKSVDKVSNCLILNVVTNTTLNHIIEFTTKKKNLRNQHGLWLFGRSGRWQAKIYNTGNYKSLLRLR